MRKRPTTDIRVCFNCNKSKTYIQEGKYERWYKHEGHWVCFKCWYKLVYFPKMGRTNYKKYYPQRLKSQSNRKLLFRDKVIILPIKIKTGQCEWCKKKIGELFINSRGKEATIKNTNIHHVEYHEDDPLKDTVELCVSCHSKESSRLRR